MAARERERERKREREKYTIERFASVTHFFQ
jgi:hypothetical protein